MITYLAMGIIVLFLFCELVIGARYEPDPFHFFNIDNSNAMRGFWCLIVVLVHVPTAYQNRIQDMIGSFAYIGVTFFFMTSSYGLSLSMKRYPNSINTFWRKRLPKLIVSCFVVNFVSVLFKLIERQTVYPMDFMRINTWVQWLLICYVIFWACHKIIGGGYQDILTSALVVMFSVSIYVLKNDGLIEKATWCPEVFGFVWGIVLFNFKDKFITFTKKSWIVKCLLSCIIAGFLGVTYLKFKPILFWGDYFLKILLGLSIILFVLLINARINIGNKVSTFLGNISFEVYLIHGLTFELVGYILPSINSGIFILVSICVTICISLVVQRISKKVLIIVKVN